MVVVGGVVVVVSSMVEVVLVVSSVVVEDVVVVEVRVIAVDVFGTLDSFVLFGVILILLKLVPSVTFVMVVDVSAIGV